MVNSVEGMDGVLNEDEYEGTVVDKSQLWTLAQYAKQEGFNLPKALTYLLKALEEKKSVLDVRCKHCDAYCYTQPSRGPYPKHLCHKCKEWTRTPVPVVANPLAQFGPIASGGQLYFSKLTFRHSNEASYVGN